ncbi:unnamed protein product, partial [Polarella glacialis]
MGNSIHKIDEGLFICGVAALSDFNRLRRLGIKCVLNAARSDLYAGLAGGGAALQDLPNHFEVKIIGADDNEECNLSVHFQVIADFIEAGRKKGGVVVHCAAGISRASTSCIAYQLIKERWDLEAAFTRIHTVRHIVCPNAGFWRQLCDLQASLIAQGIVSRKLPAGWTPPQQPENSEERHMGGRAPETTSEVLKELDWQAGKVASFVTHFLTARLDPVDGLGPEVLISQVRQISVP